MAFIAGSAGALDAAMRGLAVDLAPIRVNLVAPGVVCLRSNNIACQDLIIKYAGSYRGLECSIRKQ